MKLTTRGFTLVELMIVIAIIGILAAALFPSFTGYLIKSRDSARISQTRELSNAIASYFGDTQRYPDHVSGCIDYATLTGTKYLSKAITDGTRNHGCTVAGYYGYGSGITTSSNPVFAIVASMEGNAGNTGSHTYTGSFLTAKSDAVYAGINAGWTKGGTGLVVAQTN